MKRDAFLQKHTCVNEKTGCFVWSLSKGKQGYGRIKRNGKELRAHRYVWELYNGKIPDGLFVCHKCDNPPCVNPEHLFIGTCKDNLQDASKKGRLANRLKGRTRSNGYVVAGRPRTITKDYVRRVMALNNIGGYSYKEIGNAVGISRHSVGRILNTSMYSEYS